MYSSYKIINTKNGYTTKSNKSYYPNIEKIAYEDVIGEKVANNIVSAREGQMKIQEGGGGVYGQIKICPNE